MDGTVDMYHRGTYAATEIGTATVHAQNDTEISDDVQMLPGSPEFDEVLQAFFLDQIRRKDVKKAALAKEMGTSRSHLDRLLGQAEGQIAFFRAKHLSALARAKNKPLHVVLEQLSGFARSYEGVGQQEKLQADKDKEGVSSGAIPLPRPARPGKSETDEKEAPPPPKPEVPSRRRGR